MNRLDRYVDIVGEIFRGSTIDVAEYWPLKPAQMLPYYEDSLAVTVYQKVKILRERGVTPAEMGRFFISPIFLKNFLLNIAATGLKVATKVGWFKTTVKERVDFFEYLFDVLETMERTDPFQSQKQQTIWDETTIKKLPWNKFVKVDDKTRRTVKTFNMSMFGIVWAFYFDTFYFIAMCPHGPYKVPQSFGKGRTLVVNDYFNLKPKEIWTAAKKMPFERIRIYNIYNNIDWKVNFWGREHTERNFGQALEAFLVEVNGKLLNDPSKIEKLTAAVFKVTEKQTEFVNGLSPIEQVKKSAEVGWYGFKPLFDHFGEASRPPAQVFKVIDKLGNQFIDRDLGERRPEDMRRLFDPREDFMFREAAT